MVKKVIVAVPSESELIDNLMKMKQWVDPKSASFVFVHLFPISHYMNEFTPYAFPDDTQKVEIKASISKMLENVRDRLGVPSANAKIHCDFTNSARTDLVDFVKSEKADLVVVATRGKHGIPGLFDSSFAEYLNKYSPCDILVLRP